MATEFVVIDRTTLTHRGFGVDDGQLRWLDSTSIPAFSEPIIRDKTDTSKYWKVFIDDGQIGFEVSAVEYDSHVIVEDTTTGEGWELQIKDEQLFIENDGIVIPLGIKVLIKRRRRL